MRRILFPLYDGVESLDIVGPYDVFSMANVVSGRLLFELVTATQGGGHARCIGGLKIKADAALQDLAAGGSDVLMVPGGEPRVIQEFPKQQALTLQWLMQNSALAEATASVCFGALILAHAKLLDGRRVTTHHQAYTSMAHLAPDAILVPGARYVDNRPTARILTSAGVSAGIDLAFHMLRTFEGDDVAERTRQIMEYNPTTNFSP